MFYKEIKVEPNTAYRVTCMVKTENVVNQNNKYIGGAQISINNTTECSEALTGTNDWTELTFMFNSNNRTSLEIGFRLGGYDEYSKGTAWFSDFTIEEGNMDSNTEWNMACFIIENIDVTVNVNGSYRNVNLSMSYEDIKVVREDMKRLQDSIESLSGSKMSITYDVIEITEPLTTIPDLSGNQMTITYDVIQISEPLTSLTYDEENEYYVGPNDVKPLIQNYMERNEYDYIYVVIRLGDLSKSNEVLVHDWIGLRIYGI